MKFLLPLVLILICSFTYAQSDVEVARELANQWLKRQQDGLKTRDLYPNNPEKVVTVTEGIPGFIKPFDHNGQTVFRHYTSKEGLEKILHSQKLNTGITPYVVLHPSLGRQTYEDVVGVFLTYPHTKPQEIGLRRGVDYSYIDFTLDPQVPVMEVEKQILIIPGRRDAPDWIKKLYEDYKITGKADAHYLDIFKRFDTQGGIKPSSVGNFTVIQDNVNPRIHTSTISQRVTRALNNKAGIIAVGITFLTLSGEILGSTYDYITSSFDTNDRTNPKFDLDRKTSTSPSEPNVKRR